MEFLNNVEEHFCTTDMSLVGTLMANLTTIKFDGTHGMHEHILEMTNLTAKLKLLGMNVDEFFLVQFILNSCLLSIGLFRFIIILLKISGM